MRGGLRGSSGASEVGEGGVSGDGTCEQCRTHAVEHLSVVAVMHEAHETRRWESGAGKVHIEFLSNGVWNLQCAVGDRSLDQGALEGQRKLLEEVWEGVGGEAGGECSSEEVLGQGDQVCQDCACFGAVRVALCHFEDVLREDCRPSLCVSAWNGGGYLEHHVRHDCRLDASAWE